MANDLFHHSKELDAEGNFWAPSVIKPSNYDGILDDDGIAKISPTGEVLFKKSVAKILEENGYRGLLLIGVFDNQDPIHLNDIQPALSDSKYWKKGDLLISMRDRSTVMLYRPSSNKILWLQTGPWLNQHDADFISDHEISIFGNDVIGIPQRHVKAFASHNNIYQYNFATKKTTTPYDKIMKITKVSTHTQGLARILANGDAFVEETSNGRLLRLSPTTVKWEFVDRIDKDNISRLSWSRYLTPKEVEPVLSALQQASCQ